MIYELLNLIAWIVVIIIGLVWISYPLMWLARKNWFWMAAMALVLLATGVVRI